MSLSEAGLLSHSEAGPYAELTFFASSPHPQLWTCVAMEIVAVWIILMCFEMKYNTTIDHHAWHTEVFDV